MEFERIAPRLAAAHHAERTYRERRRAEFEHAVISMTTAGEELTRSFRALNATAIKSADAFRAFGAAWRREAQP